ncbi:MAG: Mur ligase family protein [Pseudomonadota bacterium]
MTERNLADWLAYISAQHTQTIDMGLSRMQQMVAQLELQRPGGPALQVVTIAGTNGKGSTAMALEYLLRRAGKSVGTTLSPHIQRFNERVRLHGEEVDDATLCEAFAAVDRARGDLPLTYFEFAALAALHVFKQAAVAVAILEIGLGGRLDAFNAIDADVGVITSIGLDHQEFLGDTLEAIGAEKAGILRSDQHVVLGPDMPESVLQACVDLGVQPRRYGHEFHVEMSPGAGEWRLLRQDWPPLNLPVGELAGQNIALALEAALLVLQAQLPADGNTGDLARSHLQDIAELRVPGRLQICHYEQRRWILDVAHNPAGIRFLLDQLRARDLQPDAVICGMLRNKDHAAVIRAVTQAFDVPWFLVDTQGERSLSAQALQHANNGLGECQSDAQAAVARACSATAPGDVILVFGSFSTVEQFAWLAQTVKS